MKQEERLILGYYLAVIALVLWALTSCSPHFSLLDKLPQEKLYPIGDTIVKIDTIRIESGINDSLKKVIDNLNNEWAIDIDRAFDELPKSDLSPEGTQWQNKAYELKEVVKTLQGELKARNELINSLYEKLQHPMIIKESKIPPPQQPQSDLKDIIGYLALAVIGLIGWFKRSKK